MAELMLDLEKYDIDICQIDTEDWAFKDVTLISISRKDGKPFHDWKTKQAIKEHFCHGKTAIEVYPPQKDVVDNYNVYHLWVLPFHLPFGLHNLETFQNFQLL